MLQILRGSKFWFRGLGFFFVLKGLGFRLQCWGLSDEAFRHSIIYTYSEREEDMERLPLVRPICYTLRFRHVGGKSDSDVWEPDTLNPSTRNP